MATSEHTGHPINAMNAEKLIAYLVEMGLEYNPVLDSIKIPALNLRLIKVNGKLQIVKDTKQAYDRATNGREIELADIKKLATRLVNALIGCGASKQTIADAKSINIKIQGGRVGDLIPVTPPTTEVLSEDTAKISKNISVSQLNIEFVYDNFIKLITLLDLEPLYIPNEVDLQVITMKAKIERMKTANSEVISVIPPYEKAMANRDIEMYKLDTGLVDTTKVIKAYCLSVLGSNSDTYKKINGIHFKNF
ncbi:MAG: hypothetical protein WCL51_18220 [Bacteroidota bacterium]